MVELSAMSETSAMYTQVNSALDVVYILDFSASMRETMDNGQTRVRNMVDAANESINSLMEMNPNNRVAVVGFNDDVNMLMALNHYEQKDPITLKEGSGSTTWTASGPSGTIIIYTGKETVGGATNMHAGILRGTKLLRAADPNVSINGATVKRTPAVVLLGDGCPTRSFIGSGNYYDANIGDGRVNGWVGHGGAPYAGNGYTAITAAAYQKQQIAGRYAKQPKFYTIGLGVDELSANERYLAQVTLDPKNNWNANNTFANTIRSCLETAKQDSRVLLPVGAQGAGSGFQYFTGRWYSGNVNYPDPPAYNDQYWPVQNIQEMDQSFREISDVLAGEIIAGSLAYPTDIGDGSDLNHQGYVTIEDEIGEYVEVKGVRGVLGNNGQYTDEESFDYASLSSGDKTAFDASFNKRMKQISNAGDAQITELLSLASGGGQLSGGRNYISWYAGEKDPDGKYAYLGWCQDSSAETVPEGTTRIITEYFFYNADYKTAIEGAATNLMYLTVNLETDTATGKQKIKAQIPAALLPMTKANLVRPNSQENKVDFAEPLRIFYEVGIQSGITEGTARHLVSEEYKEANKAGDETYYFYTNEHDRAGKEAKTLTTFTPAQKNPFYYFTQDSQVYMDESTQNPAVELVDGQTYYYRDTYYDLERPNVMGDIHEQWIPFVYSSEKGIGKYTAEEFVTKESGQYYIKAGVRKVNSENNYVLEKNLNVTQTAGYVENTSWTPTAAEAMAKLGNNARTVLRESNLLIVEKKVAGSTGLTIPDAEFTFEITVHDSGFQAKQGETLEKKAELITVKDGQSEVAEVTLVFDESGTAEYKLKKDQQLVISDIPEGTKYTVKETEIPENFYTETAMEEGVVESVSKVTVLNEYRLPPLVPDSDLDLEISAEKQITGRSFKAGDEFTFEITAVGDAPEPLKDSVTIKPESGSVAEIPLDGVFSFDETGTHAYLLTEKKDSPGLKDVTYDTSVYRIVFEVGTDGESYTLDSVKMEKKISDDPETWENVDSGKAVFINTFEPTGELPGEEELKVEKKFTGREDDQWLERDSFTFRLEAGDDATAQAILDGNVVLPANAAGITIDKDSTVKEAIFGNIVFKTEGTYTFAVSEVLPSDVNADNPIKDGIEYDTEIRYIKVKTTKDADSLKIEVLSKDSLVFENVYRSEEDMFGEDGESLVVTKVFTGRPGDVWEDGDTFRFRLSAYDDVTKDAVKKGDIVLPENADELVIDKNTPDKQAAFGLITFKKAGIYKFAVEEILPEGATEDIPMKDGIIYDTTVKIVTFEVTDDNMGKLNAQIKEKEELTFTNTYEDMAEVVDDANLKVIKEFTGRKDNAWIDTDSFTFTLEGADEATTEAIKAGEILLPGGGETAEVTIDKDDEVKEAVFGKLTFRKEGSFRFRITENKGSIPGVEYDSHKYEVTIIVAKDTDGKLTATVSVVTETGSNVFRNVYNPEDVSTGDESDTSLTGEKILTGKELNGGDFTFVIEALDGAPEPPVKEVTNNKDGTFGFGNITFDQPGEYSYRITEKDQGQNGYTYDGRVYTVTFKVTDNPETGKLEITKEITVDGQKAEQVVFENSYESGDPDGDQVSGGEIPGVKRVSASGDYPLQGGEFTFRMFGIFAVDEQNRPIAEWPREEMAVKNAADGNFIFPEIVFTQPGRYTYVISEDTSNARPGIIYDTSRFIVVFHVTYDEASGALKCEKTITKEGQESEVVFDNIYQPDTSPQPDVTVSDIGGVKVLTGRPLKDGEFKFVITAAPGTPMPSATETVNAGDGSFNFGAIHYTQAGTYVYEIKEVGEGLGGITYDETVYTVTVEVTETNGGFSVTVTYEKNQEPVQDVIFQNTYIPEEISVDGEISGTKILEGRPLKEGEFTFELRDETGALVATATNDKDGRFILDNLVFQNTGVYRYTVTEKNTGLGGVIYDQRTYLVEITVSDDGNGKLNAVTKLTDQDGNPVENMEFRNRYETEPCDVSLGAVKRLKGGTLQEGMFTFVLKDEKGNVVKEAVNDENGDINFGKLTFDKPGEYIYTVEEKAGNDSDVTYDKSVYRIKITVTDNGNGSFDITTEYPDGSPVFNNELNPAKDPESEKDKGDEGGRHTPLTGDAAHPFAAIAAMGIVVAVAIVLLRKRLKQ